MMKLRTVGVAILAGLSTPLAASDLDASADAAVSGHDAIVRMQGEYRVSFDFQESVVLRDGYQRKPRSHADGNEVVILVVDEPRHLVLQHVLVSDKGGHVTKHWRQDWTYEATSRFEFSADQEWTRRPLGHDETDGRWTQCVFEVDDAPRYCGTGRWEYRGAASTWTSGPTLRPLPRREYTTRSDYNVLEVVNRHTVVPGGWTHEQDNTKAVRPPDGSSPAPFVREYGINDYRHIETFDFKPAYRYWTATADYWSRVRNAWVARLEPGRIRLKTPISGMPLIEATFDQADRIQQGNTVADEEIEGVFATWVESDSGPLVPRLSTR